MIKSMAPLISLITVVMNDVSGLRTTADSILFQKFQDFEWLIIDGYSSDGSWELAEDLGLLPRVTALQTPPTGIYRAMNLGAEKSSAPWLWFVNAGDVLLSEEILGKIARIAEVSSSASAIATPVVYVTKTNHYYSLSLPRVKETTFGNYALFHHQGCLLNSTYFNKIGGFDDTLRLAADGKLLDSIIKQATPVISSHVSVGFEMGGATSRNFKKSLREILVYRPHSMSNQEIIIFRFKEFIRAVLLRLLEKPLVKYPLQFYISRRELSVIKQANLVGLDLPSNSANHD